jgi:hypothetical protein
MIHPKIKTEDLKLALTEAYIPTSYSKVEAYEKCPSVAFFRYVAKLFPMHYDIKPGEKSDALVRGNLAHERMEGWARKGFEGKTAPGEAKRFLKEVRERDLHKHAKAGAIVVEEMWSYDAQLAPVQYKSPGEWFRIKCDLAFPGIKTPLIVDHKTGKQYDSHRTQGRLYGAAFLARYVDAKSVDVEFWYLDLGLVLPLTVYREDVAGIRDDFKRRVDVMVGDMRHEPRPSRLCGWCEFSKTKGGPCNAG